MTATYSQSQESRLFNKLYWPIFIEQSLTILIGMVSTIMVSNVGAFAVSGVNLVDTVNMMVISVFNALASGAVVFIAQRVGAGKLEEAGESAAQSILLCFLTAVVFGILCILFAMPILTFLYGTASPDVLQAGYTYFIFSGISYPFIGIFLASAGILRASGNSKTPMFNSALANIVNVSAAFVLIYVFELGVLGVSIAMLLARAVSALTAYWAVRQNTNGFVLPDFSLRLQRHILRPVLQIGIPSGIDAVIFQGARIWMGMFLDWIGRSVGFLYRAQRNKWNGGRDPADALEASPATLQGG